MKIHTRVVIDLTTDTILKDETYEYHGELALADMSALLPKVLGTAVGAGLTAMTGGAAAPALAAAAADSSLAIPSLAAAFGIPAEQAASIFASGGTSAGAFPLSILPATPPPSSMFSTLSDLAKSPYANIGGTMGGIVGDMTKSKPQAEPGAPQQYTRRPLQPNPPAISRDAVLGTIPSDQRSSYDWLFPRG